MSFRLDFGEKPEQTAVSDAAQVKPPDLKKTLNLPRTDFPMQAGLQKVEPAMLSRWQKEDLYQQLRRARAAAPLFVYHDGPPYANGEVHPGTALNKILKDFIVRSRSMAGFNCRSRRPVPMRVPVVPNPATRWVIRPSV